MLPPACQFLALPLSHVRTCPVDDSLLLLVPLAHAMPCQPRCPWLTPSVSSSWAKPSAYCYRADIFFVHPYRPRLCSQRNSYASAKFIFFDFAFSLIGILSCLLFGFHLFVFSLTAQSRDKPLRYWHCHLHRSPCSCSALCTGV